jgi:hypothetical protein
MWFQLLTNAQPPQQIGRIFIRQYKSYQSTDPHSGALITGVTGIISKNDFTNATGLPVNELVEGNRYILQSCSSINYELTSILEVNAVNLRINARRA